MIYNETMQMIESVDQWTPSQAKPLDRQARMHELRGMLDQQVRHRPR